MCDFGGAMGGFWWLGMVFPVLFWGGLLAIGIWALAKVLPGRNGGAGPAESPVDHQDPAEQILRERLARGEIGAEEFERSSKVLRDRPEKTYEDYVRQAREDLRSKENH